MESIENVLSKKALQDLEKANHFLNEIIEKQKLIKEIDVVRVVDKLYSLNTEIEQLNTYLINNKLPFCIKNCNMPFKVNNHPTYVLISLIEMIKNGDLILKDAKV